MTMCPYPDTYTRHGAPDEGNDPYDLPEDHPFRGWSEQELTRLNRSLVAVRSGLLNLLRDVMEVPDADILEHLGGYTTEIKDYLDVLDTRLDEAFDSFGDI